MGKDKTILKRIVAFSVFLMILTISIYACSQLLEHKSSKIKYTDFLKADTDYDCFLMGTSIMLNSVLPMELWKDYGIASYNFGSSNCTPAEDYYILREAMKYKKPKLVVIDMMGVVEFNDIGNGKYMWTQVEAQHTQFDCFPYSKSKAEAVNDLFDIYDDRNDFLWNYIMYHNRWSELEEQDFNWRDKLNVEKGALTNTGTLGRVKADAEYCNGTVSLEGVNYDYFISLVEMCRNEDIDVLALYLPHPTEELNQRVANSLDPVADMYDNLEYINMLDLNIHDPDTDYTSDSLHPNLSGALRSTDYVGSYISSHYNLNDHRNEHEWLEAELRYYEYKKDNIIKQSSLPYYLVQLSDDDFTGEAYVYNRELLEDEWLMKLFDNAGIKPMLKEERDGMDAELIVRGAHNNEEVDRAAFKYEIKEGEEASPLMLIKIVQEDED